MSQILLVFHQVQVKIRFDGKQIKDLVEHGTVLCGDTNLDQQVAFADSLQGFDDRGHFYGFRSGAEYHQKSPLRVLFLTHVGMLHKRGNSTGIPFVGIFLIGSAAPDSTPRAAWQIVSVPNHFPEAGDYFLLADETLEFYHQNP